jgi:hypothetical protein
MMDTAMTREQINGFIDAILRWTAVHSQPISQYLGLIRETDGVLRETIAGQDARIDALRKHLSDTIAAKDSLREELEQVRVQLAGCLSVANGATHDPAKQGDYGWSVAYQAVLTLREELAREKRDHAVDEQILDAIYEAADGLPQDAPSTGKSRPYLVLPQQITKLREELAQVKAAAKKLEEARFFVVQVGDALCRDLPDLYQGAIDVRGAVFSLLSGYKSQREELAALQKWKSIVLGTGTEHEAVVRMAAAEYVQVAVQCWKDENAKLREELAQARREHLATIATFNETERELAQVKAERDRLLKTHLSLDNHNNIVNMLNNDIKQLEARIAELEGQA